VTYFARVHPSIMWAKLEALVAGARLASDALWRRSARATVRTRPSRASARRSRVGKHAAPVE
jgi:hypothetical protein